MFCNKLTDLLRKINMMKSADALKFFFLSNFTDHLSWMMNGHLFEQVASLPNLLFLLLFYFKQKYIFIFELLC